MAYPPGPLPQGGRRCSWTDIVKLCITMWGCARFNPSLFEGMSVLRWWVPPWWRRFKSPGAAYHSRVGKGKGPSAQT
jgi:hypothetical protein